MNTTKYNGWTNYDTWNAYMWLKTEDVYYKQFRTMVEDTMKTSENASRFMACMAKFKMVFTIFVHDMNAYVDVDKVNYAELMESLLS